MGGGYRVPNVRSAGNARGKRRGATAFTEKAIFWANF